MEIRNPTVVQAVDGEAGLRTVEMCRFGRRRSVDLRDHSHLMRAAASMPTGFKHWYTPEPLDQGNTPHCVAYAWTMLLMAGPTKNRARKRAELFDPTYTRDLYRRAQENDEWPGEEYDGTSVRAGAKCVQGDGYITGYAWGYDVATVAAHVLGSGPVVAGTYWFSGMWAPDAKGYVQAAGTIEGGHAYLVTGCNTKKANPDKSKGAFRILNSWGKDWGESGEAWISFADFSKLLREDGEACAPKEILLADPK